MNKKFYGDRKQRGMALVSSWVSADEKERLAAIAAAERRTISAQLSMVISDYLQKGKTEK